MGLLLGILIAFLACAGLRIWMIQHDIHRLDWRGHWARGATGLSLGLFLLLLPFRPLEAVIVAALPILGAAWWPSVSVFSYLILGALPFAAGAAVLALMVIRILPVLRRATMILVVLFGGWGLILGAEITSRQQMCAEALDAGQNTIRRNSFLWSLRHAPREYQFELHATARIDGIRHGWSYRDMAWYPLPGGGTVGVHRPLIQCE